MWYIEWTMFSFSHIPYIPWLAVDHDRKAQKWTGNKAHDVCWTLHWFPGCVWRTSEKPRQKTKAGISQWLHNVGVWDFMVLSMVKYIAAKIITKKRIYITQDVQLRRAKLTSTRNAGPISSRSPAAASMGARWRLLGGHRQHQYTI